VSEGKTVKVFSLPTCPHCQRVKTYLEKNGIVYQSVDVSEDRQARAEMIEKSGQMGVPVIDIDSRSSISTVRYSLVSTKHDSKRHSA